MIKDKIISLLLEIIEDLNAIESARGEGCLHSLIKEYRLTIDLLLVDALVDNLIRHSVREYLEMYSDYENPVLGKMDVAQSEVDRLLPP